MTNLTQTGAARYTENSTEEGKTMKHNICSIIKNDSQTERLTITWDDESGAMIEADNDEVIENAGTCATLEEAMDRAAWLWCDPAWGLNLAVWFLVEIRRDGDEFETELSAKTKAEAMEEARAILGRMSKHDLDRQQSFVALVIFDEDVGVDMSTSYDVEEVGFSFADMGLWGYEVFGERRAAEDAAAEIEARQEYLDRLRAVTPYTLDSTETDGWISEIGAKYGVLIRVK